MSWKVITIILIFCTVARAAGSNETDCEPGKVWLPCGSACPADCQNPLRFCLKQCVPGCFCPFPYLWNEKLQKCVPFFFCAFTGLTW